MAYGFFELQLFTLSLFCLGALALERYVAPSKDPDDHPNGQGSGWKKDVSASASALGKSYLLVYAIVMGADWLQGPYVYSLYREQYGFSERIVGLLFVTGFTSAGLTAPLVGVWADQHGRRKLCLAFCITYALACTAILFPFLPILLAGRLLAGLSTSILFSIFESWLISSSQALSLPQSALSTIFGRATLVNGFVATAAGVVSNQLVGYTGNFASPFIASGMLLALAWVVIRATWGENYGGGGGDNSARGGELARLRQAWRIVRADTPLLILGLTQTCFEGSMYLFVFLWVPTLQDSTSEPSLPLGYIFSAFMVSMMLGSLVYTTVTTHLPGTPDAPLVLHAKLSSIISAVSALSLSVSVSAQSTRDRFWAFCVFEACVGMYYPVQGMLRGALIPNDHRATLSSLFRVPLNVFVTGVMLTGISSQRHLVFGGCTLILGFSSIMTALVVVRRAMELSSGPQLGMRPL